MKRIMKNPVIWKGEMSMGLIRAGIGAMGGTLADQWKEFFYCDSMGKDVLVTKGQKRTSGRSSNTKVMTTSFPTAAELLLQMDSVC